MKKRCFLPLTLLFLIHISTFSQSSLELLRQDYGKLVERYEDSLLLQTATYVFVIDVSTSMQSFETTVKSNIREYISSLPDGDRVTLIQKSSTAATNFIGIPNLIVNDQNKDFIFSNLAATPFNATGSDGYRTMEKVVESISQTGIDELLYIFFFTDFEYWTQEHGYNVNAPDWAGLKNRYNNIALGHKVVSFGLNLFNPTVRSEALYIGKLRDILPGFNPLYVANQTTLENWFKDVKANTLRDRLELLVENISKRELRTAAYHVKVTGDRTLKSSLDCPEGEILTGFEVPRSGNDEAYSWCSKSRRLIDWPGKKVHSAPAHIIAHSDSFVSEKYNEVERLLGHSIEYDATLLVEEKDGIIPWWVALIIVLIILAIIACIILTCLEKKAFASLRINADWTISGKIEMDSKSYSSINRLYIGNPGTDKSVPCFQIPGISRQIEIFILRRCACRLWVRPGVYLRLNQGSRIRYKLAGSREERNLMTPGSTEFLCATNRFLGITVEFEDNQVTYSIKVR